MARYCGYGNTPSPHDDGWTDTAQGEGNVPSSWSGNVGKDRAITFTSDGSDHYHGFQLCLAARDVAAPTVSPPVASEDDGLGAGAIAGIVAGGVAVAVGVFYAGRMYARRRAGRDNGGRNVQEGIGNLIF